ncbi:MAG: hypothetical protein LLG01_10905 [Planctomycetaceae bacterium]|nr:hypothetical protein [Planctomycetaceae bacterium]
MKTLLKALKKLHKDEGGADMVEYVLIFAAVALPLLAVVIFFWKDISRWAGEAWQAIKGGSGGTDPSTL